MKTIAPGRVQHTINCPEQTWVSLTQFKTQNEMDDYGICLQALMDFYLTFKDHVEEYKQKAGEAEQAKADADELAKKNKAWQSNLERREARLQAWEQQAADERGVPYLPVQAAKQLLEAGMNTKDIQNLHGIIVAAGVSSPDLAEALKQMGGAIGFTRQLRQEIDSLTAKKAALTEQIRQEQTKAQDVLAAIALRVKSLEAQAGEYQEAMTAADQEIGKVREFAGQVEQVYRMLGFVLQNVIKAQFEKDKAGRVEHLPLRSLLYLSGSIMTVAEQLYGDQVFDMRISAENMVPIRIRLSEIPTLFAPAEAYKAQKDLIFRQMELAAQYGEENMENKEA